jgi:hypothetical protein
MLRIVLNDQNAKWLRHEKPSLWLIENIQMAYFYLSAMDIAITAHPR